MSDVMMLSKHYDASKCRFPVFASVKLDGVPGVYTHDELKSRQGKPLLGVQWIHDVIKLYIPPHMTLIGEHYEEGAAFKDISGKCRKDKPYNEAKIFMFDCIDQHRPLEFHVRYEMLKRWWYSLPTEFKHLVKYCPQGFIETPQGVRWYIEDLKEQRLYRSVEGAMIMSANGLFSCTRSWDCMKYVFDDLLDLKVCALEEAVSQHGESLGMIGALYVEYRGEAVKIGAGKMSHNERATVWENPALYIGKICKVKAKPDDTYTALRQATFQAWHEDKEEPDA